MGKYTSLIKILQGFLVVFGLFLAYQVIRKILGGSWTIEQIILAFLMFNMGITITIGFAVVELKSDQNHLKSQFKSLAQDFKLKKKVEK